MQNGHVHWTKVSLDKNIVLNLAEVAPRGECRDVAQNTVPVNSDPVGSVLYQPGDNHFNKLASKT